MSPAALRRLLDIAARADAAYLLDALGVELLDGGEEPTGEQLAEILNTYSVACEDRELRRL